MKHSYNLISDNWFVISPFKVYLSTGRKFIVYRKLRLSSFTPCTVLCLSAIETRRKQRTLRNRSLCNKIEDNNDKQRQPEDRCVFK